MSPQTQERSFEETIEAALLAGGPDARVQGALAVREGPPPADAAFPPGGWRRRSPEDYDATLCMVPRDLLDFAMTTQPKEWERLSQHYGAEVRDRFLRRVAREVESRGLLDVLRGGVKDAGCAFALAYFRPSSGLNRETLRLHEANRFSVVRQVRYGGDRHGKSLDVVLFLNGLPLFTGELKNPLTGQNVEDAIRQYRLDRDPRDPLLSFRRCLAHFAVDPDLVFVTTRLEGTKTRFLPFNQGKFGGAGNPPVPPSRTGYPSSYLWEQIWARDSVLDLVERFAEDVEEEDDEGKKTGRRVLVFPRYHQLDAVRRLVADARDHGPGRNYLVEHSAGSGKSNSIAWLAHQLSVLHDAGDRRVFDSIVVITDRRVLDRQLQRTVRQFQHTLGVVENIDKTGRQLQEALEGGKTIVVSTLQKFPVIADRISELPGKRFAVIVDEAHSSQTGESTKSLKEVLSAGSLEDAERQEKDAGEDDLEDRLVAEMKQRGRLPNVSFFAFTATPKPKTLELFGRRRPDGKFEPFSLYSMRQAIEERFILDVLENYTTYRTYWRLLKTITDDPRYDRAKASYLLRSFADLHDHAIRKKVEILVEHFHERVASRIGGHSKAMVVTRSRLHAVRTKFALDACLQERGYPYRALVAFSGTVRDGGAQFTEAGMNGLPEAQTAATLKKPEYRFLVVAEKFQTGYDEPLLHTMYVDKRLDGVRAVQTLSRLNRVHPGKAETMVLDFANDADTIRKAFEPYYEKTLLSEATDPNRLYDLERRLDGARVFDTADLDAFARLWFKPGSKHEELLAALSPTVARFGELPPDERVAFRGDLTDYVRLYAFLSQVLTFTDATLERLYLFGRLLARVLPAEEGSLPREIQQNIDMESYRVQKTYAGKIEMERGAKEVKPSGAEGPHGPPVEVLEALSQILRELNERFGTDFTEEDRVFIQRLEERLAGDPGLAASVRANTPENARLAFDHVVTDRLQDLVDTNFKFYKRVTDDPQFGRFFLDWLFERFRRSVE